MSLSICTSCLARMSLSSAAKTLAPATITQTNSFSTSSANQNVVKKKTVQVAGARTVKLRESRSARIKKTRKERPKPPPVGERKAQRKRIVLSNTNALEIPEHEKLTVESASKFESVGKVLAIDGPILDKLRDAKAFKTTQNWNMFRTPSVLLREENIFLAQRMDLLERGSSSSSAQQDSQEEPSNEGDSSVSELRKTIRAELIVGERGCGKSVYLMEAMTLAWMRGWIVINIPDCYDFVNNHSSYRPVPLSAEEQDQEQMYMQPHLTQDLLTRLAYSNADLLKSIKPTHDHSKTVKEASKVKSLHALAMLGADDPAIAPQIFNAVWKELTEAKAGTRPPVLVAIDGINHWMTETQYYSQDYKPIHAHQFGLIKSFVDLIFNKEANQLLDRVMVLAASTMSNHPTSVSWDMLVSQVHQQFWNGVKITDPEFVFPWSHTRYPKIADNRVFALGNDIEHVGYTKLNGLSRPESKGLLEYFARSGVYRERVDDTSVAEQWSLSGGGIVGELCKLGKRVRSGMFTTGNKEGARIRT